MRALLLLLLLAVAAPGDPLPLVLYHDELELRARVGLADANLHYEAERLIIRGRSKRYGVWFPVRLECTFARGIDGHVRLRLELLLVSGRTMNSRKRQAQEKLDGLVDVKSTAPVVEVHGDNERVLYAQEVE